MTVSDRNREIALLDVLTCVNLLGVPSNASEVRFEEDGTVSVTTNLAINRDDQLVALQALGIIHADLIIRGTLVITPTEVRWTEVVLDKTGHIALRNRQPVTVTRRLRVQP